MRLRLAMSPWWVQGLFYGTFFGAFMTVFSVIQTGSWPAALGGSLVGGALFGLIMGKYMSKQHTALLQGLDGFSATNKQVILRSSWRGPVPTDPRLREAARELLQRRRDRMLSTRVWSVIVFAVGTVLYVFLALTQSWLWWFAAVVFAAFIMLALTTVPRMDRRLALLADEGPSPRP